MAATIEDLFRRWCEVERLAEIPEADEDAEPFLVEYRAIQGQIVTCMPTTARELAMMLLADTDRWACTMGDDLKELVETLGKECKQ